MWLVRVFQPFPDSYRNVSPKSQVPSLGTHNTFELEEGYLTKEDVYEPEITGPIDPGDFDYSVSIMYTQANIKVGYQKMLDRFNRL